MMGLPFQCLSPLGGDGTLFCAAKGCSIQTFDTSAGRRPLFSWTHPSMKQAGNTNQGGRVHETLQSEDQAGQQPPFKRRRLGSAGDELNGGTDDCQDTPDAPVNGEKSHKKRKAKRTQQLEIPFVVLLTATENGSHVIAVTGQDKTLWVFEHDGRGSLREISQRAMPKRPCSLALTADGQTILSADKFGDVYALPLVPQPETEAAAKEGVSESTPASISTSALSSATPTPAPAPRIGANVFTVHSQRNRRALEDQQRQLEANARRDQPKEGPRFAHEVLLGHVSMLTCVLSARDAQGRPYIITADRDEHIRISRGAPQSHVVESYCLGHASFVSALCNPSFTRTLTPTPTATVTATPSQSHILISAGGDDALFVWDWLTGTLLGTADLLSHVREVLPDVTKIAVARLVAYEADDGCRIAALCERVPALFIFQLGQDGVLLSHKETLGLRGNALDVTLLGRHRAGGGRALLVSVDSTDANADADDDSGNNGGGSCGGILIFEREGESWVPRDSIQSTVETEGEQPFLSREELDRALYTVENLRKSDIDEEGDEEAAAVPEISEQGSENKS